MLPAVASIAKYEWNTKRETRPGRSSQMCTHEAVAIAESDIDRELHAEGVHLPAGT